MCQWRLAGLGLYIFQVLFWVKEYNKELPILYAITDM